MLDPQGRIATWNEGAERIKGYRAEEIVGKHISKFYPAEDVRNDKPAQELKIALEQGRFEEEGWRVRKDGSRFLANVIITPLHDASGRLRGFSKVTRDISVPKAAELQLLHKIEELNRSNAELDRFASFASHDLQEPLRMVASYTQLLAKRYQGKLGSDADEFIGFAVDGANRMQRLIKDMLLYARVGSGGADLLDVSSEEALRQAIKNLRASIDESSALVTHDPLPIVQADERQLTQLFQNLVGNAIKYQNPGIPRVHISATRNEKKWMFSVKDNGLGIEQQDFERIFVMFKRLHTGKEFTGTGIGLAICKKIVERHGGRISVESQLGLGSTFHFALGESARDS
jgi:PAS domain S-box-containing protein